jgi:hypothetical protein
MRDKGIWKILAISVVLAIVASSVAVFSAANLGIGEKGTGEGGGKDVISLEMPPFIGIAGASESEVRVMREGTNFLEEEAGISAYTNVGMEIDLDNAKEVYRTIEVEKENYTIGSVALPNYAESNDVHVYVHKDGWIVAYYLKDEPIAKMVNYKNYMENGDITLKLDNALGRMCDGVGLPLFYTTFYDFRYPNANKLMIIVDGQWVEGTDTFDMKIPSDVRVYDRSYYHWLWDSDGSSFKLDGTEISSLGGCGDCWRSDYGKLTPTQLMPDEFHMISLWHDEDGYYEKGHACVAIVLAYREA